MAPKATKRAASKPAQAPAKRDRLALQTDPNVEKCQAVAGALEAVDASVLPKVVATMLAKLQVYTLLVPKADRNKHQASVVNMTAETLAGIEAFMERAIQEAQTRVDGADADKAARDAAAVAKTREFETLDAAVKEQEAVWFQASAALEEANAAVGEAKAAQAAGDKSLEEARGRVERMTGALDKAFVPLKERAEDVDEKPLLKSIAAMGKEHAFDVSMMNAVPVALAKEVAGRSGFDNMVLSQMEAAMREKLSEMQRLVDEASELSSKHAVAVGEAVAKASSAAESKEASFAALKESKAAKIAAGEAVSMAQQNVSSFLSDLKEAGDALDERKAALAAFCAGVKAHFGELRDLAPGLTEMEEALPVASSDPASPLKEKSPIEVAVPEAAMV